MAKLVSALWRYGGYGSLSRCLFDAPEEPLSQPDPAELELDLSGDANDSSDDDAELAAWGHHLSSDEEEQDESEEEREEEEEERESSLGPWDNEGGYESDYSDYCDPAEEECWNTDGGDFHVNLVPYSTGD